MKLGEITQELIPAGETSRDVEGEVLGPEVSKTVSAVAANVVNKWWRTVQKEWARGLKDDPQYRGQRMGSLLKDRMKLLDKQLEEVTHQIKSEARHRAEDRATRWSEGRV